MRIAVDLDDVSVEFTPGWCDAYYLWFGVEVPVWKRGSWNALTEATHFKRGDHFFEWLATVPNFWRDLDPVPGALGGIAQLTADGHEIVFCTARKANTAPGTKAYLKKWGLGSYEIIHASSKTKDMAGADLYIDDSPRVLTDLIEKKLSVIRFDQPWNRGVDLPGAPSAFGWQSIPQLVKGFNR